MQSMSGVLEAAKSRLRSNAAHTAEEVEAAVHGMELAQREVVPATAEALEAAERDKTILATKVDHLREQVLAHSP